MGLRIIKYFFYTHSLFIGFVVLWYLLGDIYFGYGLVDQLIFLAILVALLLSIFLLIRLEKIPQDIAVVFIVVTCLFDVWLIYLLSNKYW